MSTAYDIGHIPERTLGRRLRDAREDTGMSQSQFAEATGMSRRTITRMEQATELAHVRKPALMAWAMATGVPLSWLQTGVVPQGGGGGAHLDRRDGRADDFVRILPFPSAEGRSHDRGMAA